jgi:DNA-binding beta-propeller fold protein YncE
MTSLRRLAAVMGLVALAGGASATKLSHPRPPLVGVDDVPLPGKATRFDYQDVDTKRGELVIAHMGDSSVLVMSILYRSILKEIGRIKTVRGVLVASEVGRIFATAAGTNELVIIDSDSLTELARTRTGRGPDGIGWDPVDNVVAVSDQRDGAVSLIATAGLGKRTAVHLGVETGNVVFDPGRRRFWASVVSATPPDQLVAIDPLRASVETRIPLPGCKGAHGLRIHPDGRSALVACEDNDVVARVDLGEGHAVTTAQTGSGPDVLAIDPTLGWLYVASESGDLVVFDIARPGLVAIDRQPLGEGAHSVAVDPASHWVFFPRKAGREGKPVLLIMRPTSDRPTVDTGPWWE